MKLKESSKQALKNEIKAFVEGQALGANDGLEVLGYFLLALIPLGMGITFMWFGGELCASIISGGGVFLFIFGLIMLIIIIGANINCHFTEDDPLEKEDKYINETLEEKNNMESKFTRNFSNNLCDVQELLKMSNRNSHCMDDKIETIGGKSNDRKRIK